MRRQEWKEHWQHDTPQTNDGGQAVRKRSVAGIGRNASTHESRELQMGSKQLRGKHMGWSRWLSSQSVFESQRGSVWGNCGFLGRSKAMWILASFKPAHFSSFIPKNTTGERPIVFLACVRMANKTIHEKPWRC